MLVGGGGVPELTYIVVAPLARLASATTRFEPLNDSDLTRAWTA
jgi:hypothetical protein